MLLKINRFKFTLLFLLIELYKSSNISEEFCFLSTIQIEEEDEDSSDIISSVCDKSNSETSNSEDVNKLLSIKYKIDRSSIKITPCDDLIIFPVIKDKNYNETHPFVLKEIELDILLKIFYSSRILNLKELFPMEKMIYKEIKSRQMIKEYFDTDKAKKTLKYNRNRNKYLKLFSRFKKHMVAEDDIIKKGTPLIYSKKDGNLYINILVIDVKTNKVVHLDLFLACGLDAKLYKNAHAVLFQIDERDCVVGPSDACSEMFYGTVKSAKVTELKCRSGNKITTKILNRDIITINKYDLIQETDDSSDNELYELKLKKYYENRTQVNRFNNPIRKVRRINRQGKRKVIIPKLLISLSFIIVFLIVIKYCMRKMISLLHVEYI